MNTGQKSSRPFGAVQRNTDLFLRIKSCRNQFKLKKCKADSLKIFKTHICLSNLGEESNMAHVWINKLASLRWIMLLETEAQKQVFIISSVLIKI